MGFVAIVPERQSRDRSPKPRKHGNEVEAVPPAGQSEPT